MDYEDLRATYVVGHPDPKHALGRYEQVQLPQNPHARVPLERRHSFAAHRPETAVIAFAISERIKPRGPAP